MMGYLRILLLKEVFKLTEFFHRLMRWQLQKLPHFEKSKDWHCACLHPQYDSLISFQISFKMLLLINVWVCMCVRRRWHRNSVQFFWVFGTVILKYLLPPSGDVQLWVSPYLPPIQALTKAVFSCSPTCLDSLRKGKQPLLVYPLGSGRAEETHHQQCSGVLLLQACSAQAEKRRACSPCLQEGTNALPKTLTSNHIVAGSKCLYWLSAFRGLTLNKRGWVNKTA